MVRFLLLHFANLPHNFPVPERWYLAEELSHASILFHFPLLFTSCRANPLRQQLCEWQITNTAFITLNSAQEFMDWYEDGVGDGQVINRR